MSGEVEFFAVIDDEQGGAGELLFLEAVLELLKQRGVGLESAKFIFELIHGRSGFLLFLFMLQSQPLFPLVHHNPEVIHLAVTQFTRPMKFRGQRADLQFFVFIDESKCLF